MMNVVAVFLIFTSFLSATLLSPPLPIPDDDITKKEHEIVLHDGLRVIVVEYHKLHDASAARTIVSISPPHDHLQPQHHHLLEEKEEEASRNNAIGGGGGELMCDAFGKCKHKNAGVFTRAKDRVVDKAHQVEEQVKEAVESVSRIAHDKKESALQTCDKARNTFKTAVDTSKTLEGDVRRNVSQDLDSVRCHVAEKAKEGLETVETATDKVKEKAKEGLETVETATEKAKEKAKQGVERARDEAKHRFEGIGRAALAAYVKSAVPSLLGVIHLMGFAMAYGMSVWITFVSSYALAGALPRQQFGMVQSKIYPLYFRAMAYSIGVALLGHVSGQRKNMFAEKVQGYNLIASLLMVFANLLYLEPKATKVMYERMKVEKEEGRGVVAGEEVNKKNNSNSDSGGRRREIVELNERLRKLNSISSTLNIITLTSLTWHLVYLGQLLHMSSCP